MFSANNSNTQINVTGFKLIETKSLGSSSDGIKLYFNGERVILSFSARGVSTTAGLTKIYTPPTGYSPKGALTMNDMINVNNLVFYGNSGSYFELYSPSGGTVRIVTTLEYSI